MVMVKSWKKSWKNFTKVCGNTVMSHSSLSQSVSRDYNVSKVFLSYCNRNYLETEYRLFPPVTKFLDLFPRAGYFFNASD